MKKMTSLLLTGALCFGLFALTGCGSKPLESPYDDYDLTEYVTLPNYDNYTTKEPEVKITDEDVEEEIQSRLEAKATTKQVKEGTVEKGDTVTISYKGTLADGTTEDGMNSDSYKLTLGDANMIDGFQEGLYGATIGEPVTLDLQFPDPYPSKEELSGKDVTFEITVLSKDEKVSPALDEKFIKENSEAKTEEEYRELVKKELEEQETETQLTTLKNEIYQKIVEETEVIKYPDDILQAQIDELNQTYKSQAESQGYADWDKFLDEYLKIDQAEFDEQIEQLAQSIVKQEMVIYAIAAKENIETSEKEYEEYLDKMLKDAGFEDAKAFEEYAKMSIEEFAENQSMDRNYVLTKELDLIYDRLCNANAKG